MAHLDREKEAKKAARLGNDYIQPWIGVDFDKTLAVYQEYDGPTVLGEPIPEMVERVKVWLSEGWQVKIFTARASERNPKVLVQILDALAKWSLDIFGTALPVTCIKDFGMVELWDDRAVQVQPNTGQRAVDVAYTAGYNAGYMDGYMEG